MLRLLLVGRVYRTSNELSPLGAAGRQYSFPVARLCHAMARR